MYPSSRIHCIWFFAPIRLFSFRWKPRNIPSYTFADDCLRLTHTERGSTCSISRIYRVSYLYHANSLALYNYIVLIRRSDFFFFRLKKYVVHLFCDSRDLIKNLPRRLLRYYYRLIVIVWVRLKNRNCYSLREHKAYRVPVIRNRRVLHRPGVGQCFKIRPNLPEKRETKTIYIFHDDVINLTEIAH